MYRDIKIRRTENGLILTTSYHLRDDENGNPVYEKEEEVFEGDDYEERDMLARALIRIGGKLGYSYDRWGKENINITFDKKGSKVE